MARKINIGRLSCLFLSGLGLGWLVGLSASPVIQTILTSLVAVVVSILSALAGLYPSGSSGEQGEPREAEAGTPRAQRGWKSLPTILDPVPVTSMVLGLALGASVGVYARANDWLAARTNYYVAEWKDTGLSPKEITTRVFDSLYPPPTPSVTAAQEQQGGNVAGGQHGRDAQPTPALVLTDRPAQKRESTTAEAAAGSVAPAKGQSNHRYGVLFTERLEQCKRLTNADEEDELRREMASSSFDELISLQRTCKSYDCLRDGVSKVCESYKRSKP